MLKSLLKGIAVGTILAGGYTLLHTPHKGSVNRKLFKNYLTNVNNAVNDLTGSLAETQNAVTKLTSQGVHTTIAARDGIQSAIQDFKISTVPKMNTIQEKVALLEQDVTQLTSHFKLKDNTKNKSIEKEV